MSNELVVVTVPLTIYRSNRRPIVAARFEQLGLTAYGTSREEAVATLKNMFNRFIHAYRRVGQLEQRLNQLGVEWCWAKDYPTGSPPFENTNQSHAPQRNRLGALPIRRMQIPGISEGNLQLSVAA